MRDDILYNESVMPPDELSFSSGGITNALNYILLTIYLMALLMQYTLKLRWNLFLSSFILPEIITFDIFLLILFL